MPCARFTLCYNLDASCWELVDDASAAVRAHYRTRAAALADEALALLLAGNDAGGVLSIRGSDGCLEAERRYPASAHAAPVAVAA